MEIRVPNYYKKFRCIADQCPDTCCAGWEIVIDEEALEKYSKYQGSFGNRLANSIDWQEGIFKQYGNKRCAFLNENNLCDICVEAGPGMFCKTCRTYPRHYEEFENVREVSLAMSCPEAAKLILGSKEPVKFLTMERRCKEEIYEQFDDLLYSKLLDAREIIFEILQNRAYPIRRRIGMVLAFTHDLQARIYRGQIIAMEEVFDRYTGADSYERMVERLELYEELPEVAKDIKWAMLEQFLKLEVLRDNWPKLLQKTMKNVDNYRLERRFRGNCEDADLEIIMEHLMIYFVFTYFCGAVYDEEAHAKMKFAVVSTITILEVAKAIWSKNPSMGKMAAILEAAKSYSREVEHSDDNIELLEELCRTEEIFGFEKLLTVILN